MKRCLLISLVQDCFCHRWRSVFRLVRWKIVWICLYMPKQYYGLPSSFECIAWVCSLEESANELIHSHPKGITLSDWMRSQSDYHMDALLSLKEFMSLGMHSILRCFVILSVELPFVTSVIFVFTTVKSTRFVQVARWTAEPCRVWSVRHDFLIKPMEKLINL